MFFYTALLLSPALSAADVERRVVVIMPFSESNEMNERLERMIGWFTENYSLAQQDAAMTDRVSLVFERYDELTTDLDSLGQALVSRRDVAAVVGPYYPDALATICSYCYLEQRIGGKRRRIPVIAPLCCSEELLRRFCVTESGSVTSPFLWSMVSSDVSLSDVLLAYFQFIAPSDPVALFLPDDTYGTTYANWLPFLANEWNISISNICFYSHTDSRKFDEAARLFAESEGVHLAVLTLSADAERLSRFIPISRVYIAGTVTGEGLWRFPDMMKGQKMAKGFCPYAAPFSNFTETYHGDSGTEGRFPEEVPYVAECFFYDALLAAGLAAAYGQRAGIGDINRCITAITPPAVAATDTMTVWNREGMACWLSTLRTTGQAPQVRLRTVCGLLEYDHKMLTTPLCTSYTHWLSNEQNHFYNFGYFDSDGRWGIVLDSRLTPQDNNWLTINIKRIPDADVAITYPDLQSQWAVLVSTSNDFKDYRHEADVLNVYQMLRRNGFPDDHIILIMGNQIAHHRNNSMPGTVKASPGGDNLYEGVETDYRIDTLTVGDIGDILLGRQSSHLPTVLESDGASNVFLYWTGHGGENAAGEDGYYKWEGGGSEKQIAGDDLCAIIRQMAGSRFRKLFLVSEPCYSESVIDGLDGIPGVLAFGSSGWGETSFAENYSQEMRVWMSDRFTNLMVDEMTRDSDLPLASLYRLVAPQTTRSHVSIVNAANFGNLYKSTVGEFVTYGIPSGLSRVMMSDAPPSSPTYYDLRGQRITAPPRHGLYIERSGDGRVSKRLASEAPGLCTKK